MFFNIYILSSYLWWLFVCKLPGSPVLGYLAAGILIGPYGLSIIRHVHGTKAIAEFGVVFLLFNIGLEVESINFSYAYFRVFFFAGLRKNIDDLFPFLFGSFLLRD